MKHGAFFRKHPVFTGDELARHLSSHGEPGRRASEAILAYYQRTGRLLRIRRGLYAVIPTGADIKTYPVDPYVVAARLTRDAVLSHHTALSFHGRAYSVLEVFTYSAIRPLGTLTFRSHAFQGTKLPRALLSSGNQYFGVITGDRGGLDVRVAGLERTLVDVLHRPSLTGSWEEIWRSLESIEFFDLDLVIEYVRILGNATTAAKVGFFLEQHREDMMVEDHHIDAFQRMIPRKPHYLDRVGGQASRLVPRWNLVVPREVLERSWAEVL